MDAGMSTVLCIAPRQYRRTVPTQVEAEPPVHSSPPCPWIDPRKTSLGRLSFFNLNVCLPCKKPFPREHLSKTNRGNWLTSQLLEEMHNRVNNRAYLSRIDCGRIGITTLETCLVVYIKAECSMLYDTGIPFLGICPTNMCTHAHKKDIF